MRRLPTIAAARAAKHIGKTNRTKDKLIMATPATHKLHNLMPTGTLSEQPELYRSQGSLAQAIAALPWSRPSL
jgi:hypothetical protein